jgi:N-acetylneuraminic acid mutarotase
VVLDTAGGLVVAGGLSSAHVSTSTVWVLSPTTGRVEHRGSLAVAVHDATGLVVNRVPFVVAGGNTTTVGDVQEIPNGGPARVSGHLPQPRSDLSAGVVEGSGYVLGGFDGATSLSAVLRTSDGRHFTTVAQLRVTVRYAAVASVVSPAGDQLLVFGGEHNGVPIDDVQDVDLTTGHTRIVGHLPTALAHEAAFSLHDRIWLAGGRSHDQLQSRIWRWDPTRHRASAAGRLPYAVADAGVAVDQSTAYIVGGETPEPTARVILLSTG